MNLEYIITGVDNFDSPENEAAIKWSAALLQMLNETTLETTIAKTKTFRVSAHDLPVSAVRKVLSYGFQRWLNDRVGGSETTAETKIESTSLFLTDVLNDCWQTSRSAPMTDETNVKRKLVMKYLSDEDRKELTQDKETRAKILDDLFAENEAVLMPLFEKEMERLREPKPKIKLAIKIANKST